MNTPFIDFKATEISARKQNIYFVEPQHIGKLISPKASMITGERGSGKTTILRHLEKTFNSSENLEYIGVYYRFETAYVKSLNNPKLSTEQNIAAFSQAMAAILGKLLCGILEEIKDSKKICYKNEQALCSKLLSDIELSNEENVNSFGQLANIYEKIRKKTLINIQNGKMICYFDYTTFLSEFCEELRKEEIFSDSCFCILFDEYENLTLSQQRVVNSYIKNSAYYLTYKVCMRPDGFWTKNTVAEREQLIPGHDYEEIDYVKDVVGTEKEVKQHMRKICANRLKYFYNDNQIPYEKEDLDIDNYLVIEKEEADIESWERIDEYKEQLRTSLRLRCPQNTEYVNMLGAVDLKLIHILLEKKYSEQFIFENVRMHTKKYKNWIHNYKKNIFFQITSECEQTKKYCGFDTIIKLSNSNTRTILEILYYAFGELNDSEKVYDKISIKDQTSAINRVSESYFEQIAYIPFNGYKTKNLINTLGNLFQDFLTDERAKKFEVNSFSIYASGLQEDHAKELKEILKDAVIWGVLIPAKANKIKNKGDIVYDGRDYVLHPIFAPYFRISYRKRQKCELKDTDVYAMLLPKTRTELRKERRTITDKNNEKYYQLEFNWS